ncbi:glycosyltransferase family 4 protein [Fibrella forsythiae]|uniref:Glycosyltransferase family 4 protein n=1 Tax=Fibrella forsythiae TaxID=2817061 RepID=A0ABS3JSE5_9BACT|nr:glycosyltransferase family 4 protein [Fibrella forsythiae]MBO0952306.1 glycosyltransferase family 4 protein [Fibrella forsythiae]
MNVLLLTYYFSPDLSAGSFRNTPLAYELARQVGSAGTVHVVTTQPNRYQSFRAEAKEVEQHGNLRINRISVPAHASGFAEQIRSYLHFYRQAYALTRSGTYDVVVASSSRLFSAFLGAQLARQRHVPLILDIRDLFRENILELLNNPVAKLALSPTLKAVERYTFGYARHINMVSEGFDDYFAEYTKATYSHFTNGIDDYFLNFPTTPPASKLPAVRTILYAGNIGEGQGLEKIIPAAARLLGSAYRFVVIGDGGTKERLVRTVQESGLPNVDIRPPVDRATLLTEYEQADYLFMHLNNLAAFERCLPSKLFEYAATDKPVLAGVAGYAAQFMNQHVPNSFVFTPGDAASLTTYLLTTPYQNTVRTEFINQFRRETIIRSLAGQILKSAGLAAKSVAAEVAY